MCIAAVLCWFLPESPVYLLNLNKTERAIAVMTRIAKFNGKQDEFMPVAESARAEMEQLTVKSDTKEKETPPIMFYLR